jgi:sec-independent protein translocase protein TatA
MGGLSIWHWLIVGILVLLLFGKGRFSDMMGDVAKGIKSFKKGMAEDEQNPASPAPMKHIDGTRAPDPAPTVNQTSNDRDPA